MEIWSRMLPLLVIVGFAAAAWWWNRKTVAGQAGVLNVLRRAPLLRGAVLAVVEVGDRHYLVGATEHSVDLLVELDEEMFAGMEAGTTKTEPWMDLFSRARTLMGRDDESQGFGRDLNR